MKTHQRIKPQISAKPFCNTYNQNMIVWSAVIMIFALVCCTGCQPATTTNDIVKEKVIIPKKIHVAFAGGGWRAHTGHSAWVMSLLESNNNPNGCTLSKASGNPDCLNSAFENVKTISGNSGGSWFSTMLMYDPDFINEITGNNAFQNWGSSDSTNQYQGWLGKQQNNFGHFHKKCGTKKGPDYLECVLENFYNSPNTTIPTPNWSKFVENLVYKGYNWKAYGNLSSSTHQPWAKDKSLLMAGTVLTNSVILNDYKNKDETYYQICNSNQTVKSNGDDGSWCVDNKTGKKAPIPDVLPVTFTSLAETGPSLFAPAFIGTKADKYNLGYAWASYFSSPLKPNTLQSGKNKTDYIPVMWASAASSAATGYTASFNVLSSKCAHWPCTYHARNLALGFKIPNNSNQVAFVPDAALDNLSLEELKNDRMIQVADGGAIDNSGVAQLIGYLQLNKQDTNFNIVVFDDVQINDTANNSTNYPSSDIAYMFEGAPSKGICIQKVCVQVPNLKIIEPNPSSANPINKNSWTVHGTGNGKATDSIHYYTYEVKTVANDSFNIKDGSIGTIHVFSSKFGCADTAPENKNDFSCYNNMLVNIKNTLRRKPDIGTTSKTGNKLLSESFGL